VVRGAWSCVLCAHVLFVSLVLEQLSPCAFRFLLQSLCNAVTDIWLRTDPVRESRGCQHLSSLGASLVTGRVKRARARYLGYPKILNRMAKVSYSSLGYGRS